MEGAAIIFSLLTFVAIVVFLGIFLRERNKPQAADQSFVLMQNQLNALQERIDRFGHTVTESLQKSSDSMNERLTNAAKVVGDLREKVGQIHEVGRAAAELVNILRAPKLRRGMGELRRRHLRGHMRAPAACNRRH